MNRSSEPFLQHRRAQPGSHLTRAASSASTGHLHHSESSLPDPRRSDPPRTSTPVALRGMRRLEARRHMEENHYLGQRARETNANPPVDLRAVDYVSNYDENLVCAICRCPFVDPVSLVECDHCFCRDCIRQTWSTYHPLGPRGDCPTCRTAAKLGPRSSISKIIVNILDELVVKCPKSEEGCKAEIKRGEVQDHVNLYCGYALVECTGRDCREPIRRKDREKGCLHFSVSCIDCHQSMQKAFLEAHWKSECPDREITCELCTLPVYYRDLAEHNSHSCHAISTPCPGAAFGCANRSKHAQAEVHAKSCALAKIAPFLQAQQQRLDEQEAAQKQMSRKLEILESGFASMQTLLASDPPTPDANTSQEPSYLAALRESDMNRPRQQSIATVATTIASPDDFDFPAPPTNAANNAFPPLSPASTINTMHTAFDSPPRRAPPVLPTIPHSLETEPGSPYASPLHHLLSLHESLRTELSRLATSLQEVEGRHSMQLLNENLRTREEMSYLGAQVGGVQRQVHWLTATQLHRQLQGGESSASGAASAAARLVDAVGDAHAGGSEGDPQKRMGVGRKGSDEGRTKL